MSIRTSTSPGPRAGRRVPYGIDGKTIWSENIRTDGCNPSTTPKRGTRGLVVLRTLLSFQRSVPVEPGNKKASDSRQRPMNDSVRDVSDSFLGRSGVE